MMDGMGDLQKKYEKLSDGQFIPKLPTLLRIDGRCFHRCTKNMKKPFDLGFLACMQLATKELMKDTGARFGYTQSDEISLLLYTDDEKSQIWFDGKLQKIISCAAGGATYFFNKYLNATTDYGPAGLEPIKGPIMFDARAWQLPTKEDTVDYFKWREHDARRNSVNMLASHHFSHKELQGLSTSVRKAKLEAKGVIWDDLPTDLKFGSYLQRQRTVRKFTEAELAKLPEKHEAKKNPNLEVERYEIMPLAGNTLFDKINAVELMFDGEAMPLTLSKKEIRIALDQ